MYILWRSMVQVLLFFALFCSGVNAAENVDYLSTLHYAERPRDSIKPSPPPEFWQASPQDRLMFPWDQRLNLVPLNESYDNGHRFDFSQSGALGFLAWSSSAACFQTGYEVEVVRGSDSFKGIPNFSSVMAPRCPWGQECVQLHLASQMPNSAVRFVPGGYYKWKGRIKNILYFPIEVDKKRCGSPSEGAWTWVTPTYNSASQNPKSRDEFGFDEQWVPIVVAATDIFVSGGNSEINGWEELTRARDGAAAAISATENGNSFLLGIPMQIENVNYVRNGAVLFSARATEACEHSLSFVLTDYKNNEIRKKEIDRRILSDVETTFTYSIAQSGFDLRSWLKPGYPSDMQGVLAVVAACKPTNPNHKARVLYDQFVLQLEAQTFFKRSDW